MQLYEHRIVMPVLTGDNAERSHRAHENLQRLLLDSFGGYTVYDGCGGWRNEGKDILDTVMIYDVAVPAKIAHHKLLEIALAAGQALGQESVYTRDSDGQAYIVPVNPEAETFAPQKRLPRPGEVWTARCGALVSVLNRGTITDGGYNCSLMKRGISNLGIQPGYQFVVDLDGRYIRGKTIEEHPLDLVAWDCNWHDPDDLA